MINLLILAPLLGVGIGLSAAYGVSRNNRRIHFVEKGDLKPELDALDISISRTETCAECGTEIEPDEIGAVVRVDGEYKAICDDPVCLDTYDL